MDGSPAIETAKDSLLNLQRVGTSDVKSSKDFKNTLCNLRLWQQQCRSEFCFFCVQVSAETLSQMAVCNETINATQAFVAVHAPWCKRSVLGRGRIHHSRSAYNNAALTWLQGFRMSHGVNTMSNWLPAFTGTVTILTIPTVDMKRIVL